MRQRPGAVAVPLLLARRLVARLARELNEALEQQAATSEVLNVISQLKFDLAAVLEKLVEKATGFGCEVARVAHVEDRPRHRADDAGGALPAGTVKTLRS